MSTTEIIIYLAFLLVAAPLVAVCAFLFECWRDAEEYNDDHDLP